MAMLSVLGRQAGKRSEAHSKGKYEQSASSMQGVESMVSRKVDAMRVPNT